MEKNLIINNSFAITAMLCVSRFLLIFLSLYINTKCKEVNVEANRNILQSESLAALIITMGIES